MGQTEDQERYLLITSDAHGGAPSADYKAFLEPRWHEEFDAWLAGVTNPWSDVNDTTNWDSELRLAKMDADGVSAEIVFPNTLPPFFEMASFLSGVPRDRASFDRKWAGLRAHNRWLVELCQRAPLRRRGVVQLLPNDIDIAVAEVEWAAGTGLVAGVMLPAISPGHIVRPYYDEVYDPLWAACAAAGLPVHQHQGTGSPDIEPDRRVDWSMFYVELSTWTRRTMAHLIVGGVFERHPTLQAVWTEFWGLRWAIEDLAHMTDRLRDIHPRYLDDTHSLRRHHTFGSPVVDGLSLTPLEYFQRNCSIGASLLPRHDVKYAEVLGIERIMWGTDFPHDEGSAPNTTAALRATMHDQPTNVLRAMLGANAARLYDFDIEALKPIAARIGPRVDEVSEPLEVWPQRPSAVFLRQSPLEKALSN